MNWLQSGMPLLLLGGLNIWLATKMGDARLNVIGGFYVCSSLFAISSNRTIRKIAVLAWCPLLLAIPVGTIVGISAIRLLLRNPAVIQATQAKVKAMSSIEVEQFVRRKASNVLEIPDSKFDVSIERQLMIAPVALIHFLDDLNIDYGLPVSSDDRTNIDTVEDLVQLLASRLGLETGVGRTNDRID